MTFRSQLLTIILLLLPALAAAQLLPEVKRPDLVRQRDREFTILAEPETQRVISPGTVMFHVIDPSPPVSPAGVEAVFTANAPVDVEMTAIYRGKDPLVFERRSISEPNRPTGVRWETPMVDELTSFTLTVRSRTPGASAQLNLVSVRDLTPLKPYERLRSFSEHPMALHSAIRPVRDGKLALRLRLPDDLRILLHNARTQIEWSDDAGHSESTAITIDLPLLGDQHTLTQDFALDVPPWATGDVTLKLMMTLRNETTEIAALRANLRPAEHPVFEIGLRSIEDFAPFERNGELVLYSAAGDEGVSRGVGGASLPADGIWLAAGNGVEWAVNEQLLRTHRNTEWVAGGAHSLSIDTSGPYVYGFFTSVSATGREGFCLSMALNSLRVSPSAKNPVWQPRLSDSGDAPTWRGNAFFDVNGARMIVGLEKIPGQPVIARTLTSNFETRWIDLGPLPLPGLKPTNSWISSYTDGHQYFLLTGPEVQLFTSTDLLRDWKEVPFTAPDGWGKMQIMRWAGGPWLFGIQELNGRGVIAWRPVRPNGDSFDVIDRFQFSPPPLIREPSLNPVFRNETDVR